MRTITHAAALLIAVILPATASAVILEQVSGVADCNGWQADVRIWFRDGATDVTLTHVVVLTDADGQEVQRFEETETLELYPGELVDIPVSGTWAATPTDGWQVTGDFTLLDNFMDGNNKTSGTFTTAVVCVDESGEEEPAPTSACVHPPGWWRSHEEAWPMDHLAIGGQELGADQIMQILEGPVRGNVLMVLARQVVAAKFNVMIDPAADMDEAIARADAFLTENPPLPGVDGNRRRWDRASVNPRLVREMAFPIIWYNGSGCTGVEATTASNVTSPDLELLDKAVADADEPGETVSFGTMKSMYR